MDRRHFIVAALAGTSAVAVSSAPARATGTVDLSDVQAALGSGQGEPIEMQRRGGRGPGGGGGRRGGGFRGGGRRFRGGGRRFRGGGWGGRGWRRRGFYGRPYYRRRYYGGPYYGGGYYGGPWGYRRRCWINRFGRRVCRRPAIPFPFFPVF